MFCKLIAASSIAATLALAPLMSQADPAPTNHKEMAKLQYLVGTWHCRWQMGDHSGTQDQIFTPALNGAWLEEQEIVTIDGRPTVNTIHYTGWDPQTKTYVHVGPDADGTYELAQSPDSDTWNSTDGTLIHHRISDSERELSETGIGPTAPTVRMSCLKSPQ
jgi:hypothetical protein